MRDLWKIKKQILLRTSRGLNGENNIDFNMEKSFSFFKTPRLHYFFEKLNPVGLPSGFSVSDLPSRHPFDIFKL